MVLEMEQMLEQGDARGVVKAEQEPEVAVHSQVRKIKQEDEKARELLMRLQLLEMRPVTGFREPAARQTSPSPLQRAGRAISVGD
ncbi:hypothetical protein PR202_ga21015 [Eleusine coracana subsp. coracana]|uniref:Uncharacterized protein n=1 Tax=Eleusine coracana subsp. coracana TaxID=191504 RepID=A0AAV5CZV9_ELECO|nr:hypothetical protein QOZ80_8AG0631350 [Eleusine coracana subsp. coracana]GJN03559.1 hypothetical protein PR202_ga21015 [Eleusine coracana subsp. coracana]